MEVKLLNPLFISKKMLEDKIRQYADYLMGEVLDIGCGRKPYKKFLKCKRYIGMDLNKKISPDIVGEVINLPFRDGTFDNVICTEVLEHVMEPSNAINEIRRVLKRNGLLYITAPMSWCLHYEPYDFYRYTKYGLKYLLEKNGFEVLELERIGGLFSLISVRFIDGFYTKVVYNLFFFLPSNIRFQIMRLAVVPLNLILFYVTKYLDKLQKKDAIGWIALAREKEETDEHRSKKSLQ